jgi:hypothetical protein
MYKLVYVEDTGLYENLVILMANTTELREFVDQVGSGGVLVFGGGNDDTVTFRRECESDGNKFLDISKEKAMVIAEVSSELLAHIGPCHNYVDLPEGYTLMLSKDEYKK